MLSFNQMIATTLFVSYLYVTSAKICDEYRGECSTTSLDVANKLRCRGMQSCYVSDIAAQSVLCPGYYSCYYATLDVQDSLECNGWLSCKNAKGITAIDASVTCSGPQSCSDIDSIQVSDEDLICSNWGSCANIDELISTGSGQLLFSGYNPISSTTVISQASSILCNGYKGCNSAYISATGTDNFITSEGQYALMGSSITETENIECNGDSSCYKAEFDSEGLSVMNVYANGYSTLSSSSIHCRESSTCTVECASTYNSCYNVDLFCYEGASCIVNCAGMSCNDMTVNCYTDDCQINCDYGIGHGYCPTINSDQTSETLVIDMKEDRIDDDFIDLDALLHEISDLHSDSSIACDESSTSSSCFGEVLTASSLINCGGYRSCVGSQLRAIDNHILCIGDSSCQNAVSLTGNTVRCGGFKSCMGVDQFDVSIVLMCDGLQSCSGIDLTDSNFEEQYISCIGDRSCKSAVLTGLERAMCYGTQSCLGATIHASNDVTCQTHACYRADITALTKLYANGPYAAVSSTITAPIIYARGYLSLQNSVIETAGLVDDTLYVQMHGFEAGDGAEIHCREGKTCTLECAGNSCANTDFYCYDGSECILTCRSRDCTCDETDIDYIACPSFPLADETTMNVIANKVLSVNDGIKYENAMWKLTPSIYGVLVIGLFACVLLTYSFYVKWNAKEYQTIG